MCILWFCISLSISVKIRAINTCFAILNNFEVFYYDIIMCSVGDDNIELENAKYMPPASIFKE